MESSRTPAKFRILVTSSRVFSGLLTSTILSILIFFAEGSSSSLGFSTVGGGSSVSIFTGSSLTGATKIPSLTWSSKRTPFSLRDVMISSFIEGSVETTSSWG